MYIKSVIVGLVKARYEIHTSNYECTYYTTFKCPCKSM